MPRISDIKCEMDALRKRSTNGDIQSVTKALSELCICIDELTQKLDQVARIADRAKHLAKKP